MVMVSLWPSDSVWRQIHWSTLIQVMVCGISGSNPITRPMLTHWTSRSLFHWNWNKNTIISIHWNAFENIYKMAWYSIFAFIHKILSIHSTPMEGQGLFKIWALLIRFPPAFLVISLHILFSVDGERATPCSHQTAILWPITIHKRHI